ncbi:cryptochrome DASH-like [Ptychodera flava]|uniref:cryptochrome DASH-like n=1 Tax=Ptychodera flava TaxID=63121 RepID=UPI00396A54F6
MASNVIICLLRNDLRLHDNEALNWANHNADHVIPLYCFDPRHFNKTDNFHFQKTGPHRFKFLVESVHDLRQTLHKHGSGLVIRKGEPEKVVPELIKSIGKGHVKHVVWQEEAAQDEIHVEKALEKSCGVPIKKMWGLTLYHRDDLPFKIHGLPDVFPEFREKTLAQVKVRPIMQPMQRMKPLPPGLPEGDIPRMEEFGIQAHEPDKRSSYQFHGGESTALERLHHYLSGREMHGVANHDHHTTKFSAWLALGCLSPRMVYEEIKKCELKPPSEAPIHWYVLARSDLFRIFSISQIIHPYNLDHCELMWRDYFKFVSLKYGEKIFNLHGLRDKHMEWKADMKLFNAWKDGKTGVPFIDANMREIAATGFMSNVGRLNVASFLTQDLKLDWRLGAEWFEYLLIDHDVCSNYGNWLYSAGVGNDPGGDKKMNVVKQGLQTDPKGDYVRLWVPELAGIKSADVHAPWIVGSAALEQTGVRLGSNYPSPVIMVPEWTQI